MNHHFLAIIPLPSDWRLRFPSAAMPSFFITPAGWDQAWLYCGGHLIPVLEKWYERDGPNGKQLGLPPGLSATALR